MATITANLPPLLSVHLRKPRLGALGKFPASTIKATDRQVLSVVKATTREGSESSSSLSIIKSVQNAWDKSEDRVGVIGLGFAAIVALWASANLISAIDSLPIIPGLLEFIGILFSLWFTYRYLLFKPNREEFAQLINKYISDIWGQ